MRASSVAVVLLGLLVVAASGAAAARTPSVTLDKPMLPCTDDLNCTAKQYCDSVDGCVHKLNDMKLCVRDPECKSGACKLIGFLGPLKKICVHACANSTQCPATAPVCIKIKAAPSAEEAAHLAAAAPLQAPLAKNGTGLCVQCQLDSDCTPDEYCIVGWSPDSYSCSKLGPVCLAKADCPPGMFCDKIKGHCKRWVAAEPKHA